MIPSTSSVGLPSTGGSRRSASPPRRLFVSLIVLAACVGALAYGVYTWYVNPPRFQGPGDPRSFYGYEVVLKDPADTVVTDLKPPRTVFFRHEIVVPGPGTHVVPVADVPPVVVVHAVKPDRLTLAERNLWALVLQEGAGRIFMPDSYVRGGVPGLITGIAGQAWAWNHLKWAREYGVIHGLREYAREVGPSKVSAMITKEYGREPWKALVDFCRMMAESDVGRFLKSRGLSFEDFLTAKNPMLVAEVLTVLDLGRLDEKVARERLEMYVLPSRAYPMPVKEEKVVRKAAEYLLRHPP